MIVAAHQPNFLPWLGYFDKMAKADLFISVDHVQMERQSYQVRTRIKTYDGPRWITVPVLQKSRDEKIFEKQIDNARSGRFCWRRKMLSTIRQAYQSAPFYRTWEPLVADIFGRRWDYLRDLNETLILGLRDALKISTPMVRSSGLNIRGAKSDMVLDLCRTVKASVYLAGTGASRDYLDVAAFERAGIEVRWLDFVHPEYPQVPSGDPFTTALSSLDMLFNCGHSSFAYLPTNLPPRRPVDPVVREYALA